MIFSESNWFKQLQMCMRLDLEHWMLTLIKT